MTMPVACTATTTAAPKTEAHAEKNEAQAQFDATIERYKNIGFPLAKYGWRKWRYEFYCKEGHSRNKTTRTKKLNCEFKAWVFKNGVGAWCEETSGRHNHPRSFLYEHAITFDPEEKKWKVTDRPPPDQFDNLPEIDYTAYNTVNAAPIRDGPFDVTLSSEPYHASEHHKYDLTAFPALLDVALSTFMVLRASSALLDVLRSAGHEQGLGDDEALATESEQSNLVRRELLRFLVSSTRLSKERV